MTVFGTSARRSAGSVFLILLGVYLATSSFRIDTIDTAVRLEVARSLADGHGGALAPLEMRTPFGIVGSFAGRDGRFYSVYGLGQSLLMLPAVLAGRGPDAMLVTLLNPLATAGAAALLVLLAARFGYSRTAGVRLGLLFGLATLAWPQAKFTFEAPIEMFAATLALFLASRPGPRSALGAGAAIGFALLTRPSAIVMVPAVAWLAAGGTAPGRRLAAMAAGAVPFVIAVALHNVFRWGSPFATGYVLTGYRYFSPSVEALAGLLVSPGRGFFWYSPILLLAPFGARAFLRSHRRLGQSILALAVSYLAFLGSLTIWSGDWTWGPRHLLPVVPALSLLLLPKLEPGALRAAILGPLAALSVAVQLVGVSVSYDVYYLWHNQWVRDTGARERAGRYHFDPLRSQLYVETRQALLFYSQLPQRLRTARAPDEAGPYDPILGGNVRVTKRVPDLWWFYFPLAGHGPLATGGLAALCAALIGGGVVLLRRDPGSGTGPRTGSR